MGLSMSEHQNMIIVGNRPRSAVLGRWCSCAESTIGPLIIPCKDIRQLNSHAKLGPHCLQLAGGAPRRLVARKYSKSTISRPVSQMDMLFENTLI